MLRYRQLEIRNAPKQPEGPAEERSGGTVRNLARERRNGRRDTPEKQISPAGTGEAAHGSERKTNPEPKQEDKQNERIPEKQTV